MADQPDIVGDVAQVLRLGRIASVDRAAGTCTVAIGDPDGEGGEVITDSVPWAAVRAGRTTVWSPPSDGEQCALLAPGGDIAQAIALPGIFCAAFPAPGDPDREFVRFGDRAMIAYDAGAHALDIDLPGGGTVAIAAPGGISIQGNLTVEGEIEASGDVIAGEISLQRHTHGRVQAGGSNTGEPE
jgi:phage baseplate assembly protein V